MTRELKKRILTSILLFLLVFTVILINKTIFAILLLLVSFICYLEWKNINIKDKKKNFTKNLTIFIGGLYLFIFFISAYNLRGDNLESSVFFLLIISICICSDIGGYLFGKIIGGVKLTKISPNKTVSGSLGSLFLSTFPIYLFNFQTIVDLNFVISLTNISFCLFISIVSQLGDLLISYFKRLNKVKDTGKILPGHGGLLDRIDGIIFVIPLVYLLKILEIF